MRCFWVRNELVGASGRIQEPGPLLHPQTKSLFCPLYPSNENITRENETKSAGLPARSVINGHDKRNVCSPARLYEQLKVIASPLALFICT